RSIERTAVRRRTGGEWRGAPRSRRDARRTPERTAVGTAAGDESRPGHHRERGGAPTAGVAHVVVAGADAAYARGGRVGLYPVWRPDARRGHHRGPRRDPADSPPPRAPDRSGSAPTTAVRPVRLELKVRPAVSPFPH